METFTGAGYTVLLVDDDRDLLPSLVMTIETLSACRVVTATNGVEGLERFAEEHPHCVVIDVKMPELDGVQMVRAIRGDPATADTPLVILTAMAQDKDRFAGLAAGVDQYLTKPVEATPLVEAIHRALQMQPDERIDQLRRLAEAEDA
jgi:CheY-like chemotaxis protein